MQRLAAVTRQHRSAASPPPACSDADARACRGGNGKPVAPVPDPQADAPPSAARARGEGSSSLPSAPPPPPPPPKLDDCPRNWAAEQGRGGWAPAIDGTYVFGALGPDQGTRCGVLVWCAGVPVQRTLPLFRSHA